MIHRRDAENAEKKKFILASPRSLRLRGEYLCGLFGRIHFTANRLGDLFSAGGGFANAAHSADGLLIDRRFLLRMSIGHADGFAGIWRVQISADFFAQSFSALVDSAAAHDLHLRATVHLAEIV